MRYCLSALPEIDAKLRPARRLLIAADFDGTLCPIADSPASVCISPAMMETVRRLASSQRITFVVTSGRALDDVAMRLPVDITFSGNHGLEIRGCGLNFQHPEAHAFRSDIAAACATLQNVVIHWSGSWIEDKALSATVHYRQVGRRHHRALLYAIRQALRPFGTRLAYRVGQYALDVRPRMAWDKGAALSLVRERLGPFDTCICLGDDRIDEAMFRTNQDGINIRVRPAHNTSATHYLSDPSEVAIFLSHVIDVCGLAGSPESTPIPAMGAL